MATEASEHGIRRNQRRSRRLSNWRKVRNDTHFTEKLQEKEKSKLSRSSVRRILRGAGIAAVRKRGVKRHYKRRERKAQEGELLLWDGSPHRWFGEEQSEWSLMAVIDDATGALLHGVFALEEDAQSYLICLRQILLEKGIPLALYSVHGSPWNLPSKR